MPKSIFCKQFQHSHASFTVQFGLKIERRFQRLFNLFFHVYGHSQRILQSSSELKIVRSSKDKIVQFYSPIRTQKNRPILVKFGLKIVRFSKDKIVLFYSPVRAQNRSILRVISTTRAESLSKRLFLFYSPIRTQNCARFAQIHYKYANLFLFK